MYISCYEVMRCLFQISAFFLLLFHSFQQQAGSGFSVSSVSTWGATRGQRQVKKGNKPYTDDLTQLRAKPEDFQSEEEEVDSASEVGIMGGWVAGFWAQFP